VIHRGDQVHFALDPVWNPEGGKICLIGNGVVIDPVALVAEIDGLRKLGIKIDKNLPH